MFQMSHCYFYFYSSFKVLFVADAKISYDSFRNGMAATVNSKTIITVNPGKTFTLTSPRTRDTATRQPAVVNCVQEIEFSRCASRIFLVRKTFQSHDFQLRHQRGQPAVQLC